MRGPALGGHRGGQGGLPARGRAADDEGHRTEHAPARPQGQRQPRRGAPGGAVVALPGADDVDLGPHQAPGSRPSRPGAGRRRGRRPPRRYPATSAAARSGAPAPSRSMTRKPRSTGDVADAEGGVELERRRRPAAGRSAARARRAGRRGRRRPGRARPRSSSSSRRDERNASRRPRSRATSPVPGCVDRRPRGRRASSARRRAGPPAPGRPPRPAAPGRRGSAASRAPTARRSPGPAAPRATRRSSVSLSRGSAA